MSSDTALVFRFVPVGEGAVQRAFARTAASSKALDAASRESATQMHHTGAEADRMGSTVERAYRRMGDGASRNGRRTSQELFKIDNVFRNTARRWASVGLLIGGAIAAIAGNAVALTDALWPMIGALATLPAVGVAGIAGIAALVVGFKGLAGAMKSTGGSARDSAQQIANAEHRIEQAHRNLTDAERRLSDAREEASDRLRDIQTQYARMQLDQQEAALAVKDAELALRAARSSGDRLERQRAELALQSARLSQIEVANRLTDVEQEYQDRIAKGVEHSDEVTSATQHQADAMYELAEAQRALVEAQRGGGGANAQAEAYAKLSASGKALVDTFRALGPQWRQVQQATQERVFAGVAADVKALSMSYLPVMLRQLPAIGQGWNNMLRSISAASTEAGFVRDMDDSLGLMAIMWQRVGGSFGKFFSGFRDWVRVGADFMPRLGSWVDRMATRWELWSAQVRATGKAHQWIEKALVAGRQFNQLMGAWGTSLYKLFALGNRPGFLEALVAGSQAFRAWLDTAEGQQRISQMWERMQELGSAAWRVIKALLDVLSQLDTSALTKALELTADALGTLAKIMPAVNPLLSTLILGMAAAKVATIGASLALKGFNLTLAGTPARVGAATAAVGTFARALGPAGLLAAGFWEAYDHIPEGRGWQTAAALLGGIGYDLHALSGDKMMRAIDNTTNLAKSGANTAKAFADARTSAQKFTDLLKAQTDPLFGYMKAQDNVTDALKRYQDVMADPHHTTAQAEQAARDLAEAQLDLQAAMSGLSAVKGPELLKQLEALRDAGYLSADAFNTLKAAIDKIPAVINKEVDIRLRASMDDAEWREFQREVGRANLGLPHFAGGGVFRAPSSGGAGLAVLHDREAIFTPEQQAALARSGGRGGGAMVLEIRSGGSKLDDLLVELLRRAVRVRGGNVQAVLGNA